MFRESASCTSMSAVSIPTPITRANTRTIACGPCLGACSISSSRAFSICRICSLISRRRSISRRSSANVVRRYWLVRGRTQIFEALGGLLHFGIEAADAEPAQRCFHPVDDPSLLSDKTLALAVGSLGILVLNCRNCDHLAVIPFAAQPTKKSAFEQLGVETVGLGAPVFTRYRYARCVDDMGLDAARPEPARQPETISAGLEGNCDAFDLASCFLRFLSPSMQ